MKEKTTKLYFNNGTVIECPKAGEEIKWNNEHWPQEANIIKESTVTIEEKENHSQVRVNFSTKWMPFHQWITLQEIDPIEVVIDIEETPKNILSFYYFNDWWTRPGFISDMTQVRDNTCILLYEGKDGYSCLLAMPGENFSTRFAASEKANEVKLILTADAAGYTNVFELSMIKVTEKDPYRCIKKCMEEACRLQNIPTKAERKYPEIFEKIGWCSWDAFYQDVSEEGLIAKSKEIKEKSIPFGWMLIDDGWLDTINQCLRGYDADKTKFPNGLKECVRKMKEISNADDIGVWHAFSGYWGGVDADSSLYEENKNNVIKTVQGRILPKPKEDAAHGIYSKWHKYLKNQDISFIKVDSQSSLRNQYRANSPIGKSARELHKALDKSAMENMDGNLINCMGMAMENVLARPQSAISRNSDDFVPLRENGFEEHMLQNVYNSLYHNAIYYGDWDMFWSNHEDAQKHALLRALSGGPVYVSDKVGESDADVIKPLCYKDGTILRANQAAVPTEDCIFADPLKQGYIKIKNTCNNVNYLAIYAFGDEETQVEFSVEDSFMQNQDGQDNKDIEDKATQDTKNERYVVYCPKTQEIFVTDAQTKHKINLDKKGYIWYQIAKIENGVAIFGTKEHYLSSHNIKNFKVSDDKIQVELKEKGTLVLYDEDKNRPLYVNGEIILS